MPLSEPALRVLGSLLEKERTTPDAYPLSTQALVAACNQKTARDPVLNLHLREVEEGLQQLRDRGLAQTIRGSGDRVPKHRQRLTEAASLTAREAAVLAVLLLRGPQTAGELRTRTERYGAVPDVAAAEDALARLEVRSPALVVNRGRGPGQSQDRWAHTLGRAADADRPRVRTPAPDADAADGARRSVAGDAAASPPSRDVDELLRRLEALEARVDALEADAS